MTLIINDQAFLAKLAEHRRLVRRLSGLFSNIDDAQASELVEQASWLFGETTFLDMAICAAARRMPEAIVGYDEFMDAVWDTVRAKGVVTWLFRMLWNADADATRAMLSGDAAEAAAERAYLRDVCAMAATIMLRWVADNHDATRYALLLLGGRHDDVLSMWLPQTGITVDADSFRRVNERLERHRAHAAMKERMTPPAPPAPPAWAAASAASSVGTTAPPAPPVASAPMPPAPVPVPAVSPAEPRTVPPAPSAAAGPTGTLGPAELQYLFDAHHVADAYRSFWRKARGEEPDEPNPGIWGDRDFAYGQLVSLTGATLVADPLDDSIESGDREQFDMALGILDAYAACVRANGLAALPAHVVTSMAEGLGFGDAAMEGEAAFEKAHRLRAACLDMAGVALARIPDLSLRRTLATQLVAIDMDAYFATVESWSARQVPS